MEHISEEQIKENDFIVGDNKTKALLEEQYPNISVTVSDEVPPDKIMMVRKFDIEELIKQI